MKNTNAISKIIAALDIKKDELIIEIGPGKGALTLPLAEGCTQKSCKLIAIEKDAELAKKLGENLQVIEGDALEALPDLVSKLERKKYKLVGNIPYYITGKLLRIISELEHKPELTVLMIQKEVAERISAVPPKTNLLSAATQFWAIPEIILKLKPADFDPAPEVDSAVIKLTTKIETEENAGNYYRLIHIIFKQPRKTLLNNLQKGLGIKKEKIEPVLSSLKLPLTARPQDLSINDIIKLSSITTQS